MEERLAEEPWHKAREGVEVKLLPESGELYVLAHSAVFISFLSYCLHVTLRYRLNCLAPGLTPRAVFEKAQKLQMVDVSFPTTDGRILTLPRRTEPEQELQLILDRLKLQLPPQPKPKISADNKIVM